MKGTLLEPDVLIVGAGPAGSSAARSAAQAGARTLVLERRSVVGVPVQCAEYIPTRLALHVQVPAEVIVQKVEAMETFFPPDQKNRSLQRGFIIHRDRYDQLLARRAVQQGAQLKLDTCVSHLDEKGVWANTDSGPLLVKAKIIIGADGTTSHIGRHVGFQNRYKVRTLQWEMPSARPLSDTLIYFSQEYPGGYGWIFPKGEVANVGVGVDLRFGVKARPALEALAHQAVNDGWVTETVLCTTGGQLPVGGALHLRHHNIILAGDAAGHCHPITGAGISNATLAGELAGHAAARAALSGNLDELDEYVEEATDLFNNSLAHAAARRKEMLPYWQENAAIATQVRRSWIAFDEYYGRPQPAAVGA